VGNFRHPISWLPRRSQTIGLTRNNGHVFDRQTVSIGENVNEAQEISATGCSLNNRTLTMPRHPSTNVSTTTSVPRQYSSHTPRKPLIMKGTQPSIIKKTTRLRTYTLADEPLTSAHSKSQRDRDWECISTIHLLY
jgi:hypothetical protein